MVTDHFVPLLAPPDTPVLSATRWFCVRGADVAILDAPPAGALQSQFLGMLGTAPCWAVDVPTDDSVDAGLFRDLRRLWGEVPEIEWTIAGRAVQIVEWVRTHCFCGRCGTATEPSAGDRSMRCPSCSLLAYPRLAPAVIMLVSRGGVSRGGEVLLGRGRNFPLPMYSCLAGFVEPGETLEQAVVREVREEVGVAITNVRYQASQPWPFPHSLMLGFTADWVSGDIMIDESEIVDAQWFTADTMPMIPPPISIARKLIDGWLSAR